MADEIETLDELIERAELSEVAIHDVIASREAGPDTGAVDLPSEKLHAPESPYESAALEFGTRVWGDRLEVRCCIATRNAFASFKVNATAAFSLLAPISARNPDIVGRFVEQVGAPALFPYVRAAVAALAAQLSVAAEPLPVIRPGEVDVGVEDSLAAQQVPDGVAMQGKMEITNDDGSVTQILEFFHDAETGEMVRFGGDDVPADVHELLDAWAKIGPLQEVTWDWAVRAHGEQAAREAAEELRLTQGDEAADRAITEIEETVQAIAVETAANCLGEALEALNTTIAATKVHIDRPVDAVGFDEREVLTALLDAATRVMGELDELRTAAG